MRRTKIVCTIGPASFSPEMIQRLVRAGMDVARLNFSHGTHEEHGRVIAIIRQIAAELGAPVAILQDLQGPKIRLGTFRGGNARLTPGADFSLTTRPVEGTAAIASATYERLPNDVHVGDRILLVDGLIELRVLEIAGDTVRCRVVTGGDIGDHKGINLPGVAVSARSVTDKDQEDLRFGIAQGVDAVAVSFIRGPKNVLEVKELIATLGGRSARGGQAGKTGGNPAVGRHFGRSRWRHGGPRRSGGGVATGGRATGPKGHHPTCATACHPGDHGDSDAGIDGPQLAADPGRSLGRGQRHSGRHRRRDAVRGDRRRELSCRDRGRHGAHRRAGRDGPTGSGDDDRASLKFSRCDQRGRLPRRQRGESSRDRRLHAERLHGAPPLEISAPGAHLCLLTIHRRSTMAQSALGGRSPRLSAPF